MGQHRRKLTTAVASGSGPDVLQVGLSKLRTFADAGALLAARRAARRPPRRSRPRTSPAGIGGEASAVAGEIVSVPWVSDTRVLFTRTDILAENGIDAPPTTWEQLRADAKTLAGRGEGQYGYYIPQWDSPLPVVMTWSNGGDIIDADGNVDFDTPEFDEAVDLYTGPLRRRQRADERRLRPDAGIHLRRRADAHQRAVPREGHRRQRSRARRQVAGDDGARGLGVGDVAVRRARTSRSGTTRPRSTHRSSSSSTSRSPRPSSSGTPSTASCPPRSRRSRTRSS